ncbi:histidine kinase [Vibrio sp. UCD-FRSSP16_10]|uniref:alpha/beta fold hydrolase n=1 Tax=unclassified Vibrio TaxID=2614977 RepID=UPI0007FEBFBB|nr:MULTISPECIES: alpha/beta fold hydrolase [unclassified Vibrio]OBT08594.1 histidine kinase [Vibrio sp. UCD-FRSSP16_30]OBT18124.1 histidine kinase [Vibrio sp. UCD-FRSSP16_10]
MSSQLHYKIQGSGQPILLIHGLFGSLDNLGLLARDLESDHQVISVDLRNHGRSPHLSQHTYAAQANDILNLINDLGLSDIAVVGHSMGGKVAMTLTSLKPELFTQLIVLDMAPVAYHVDRHSNVFAGIQEVAKQKPKLRSEAMALLAQHIELDGVRQFLSKSLYKNGDTLDWRFNHLALHDQYLQIMGWEPLSANSLPTLFIKGGDSDYIQQKDQKAIMQQFPCAKAHIISNTGHWLHAEKPDMVLRTIRKFIAQN